MITKILFPGRKETLELKYPKWLKPVIFIIGRWMSIELIIFDDDGHIEARSLKVK